MWASKRIKYGENVQPLIDSSLWISLGAPPKNIGKIPEKVSLELKV